ncbi:hypothetical protein B0H13DRAFT_1850060 [Mycena leptocephala]|nr:hypothetical protein B0H13DRAFT_1850060 [Mycena leptocephala]
MCVEHRTWKQQLVCKSKSESLNGEGELNEATNPKAETCTKVMHPSGPPYAGLALGAAKPRLGLEFNPGAYTMPGTLLPITIGIERSQKGLSGTLSKMVRPLTVEFLVPHSLIQCDVVAGRHFVFMGKVGDSEDVLKIRNRNAVCLCFKCSSLEVYDARGINVFEEGAEGALLVSTQTNGQLVTRSFDDRTRSLWKREQSSKDWGIPDDNEPMNLITGQLIPLPMKLGGAL